MVVTFLFSFMPWPVSCPCVRVVLEFWCLTVTFLMSVAFHFLLRVLVKAVMMNKKITGERLSPWQNPTVWSIWVSSFLILRVTLRLVYNLLMAELS